MNEPARQTKKRNVGWVKWLVLIVIIAAASAGGYWYWKRSNSKVTEFRTAKITLGDITNAVTANGQLTPVKNVQVGSQVSGIIREINVDFNSKVKEGDVIARIDPSTYERNLTQAEAELANASAGLELAEFNYKQAKQLFATKLISESDHQRAEVDLHQAQAIVKMRTSNVERAKVDLSYTIIKAPIDGIVISRNVEAGQTMAATFNAPTLFVIANDLAKMQIEAAVSEADVGGVEEGQTVNFTVEAFFLRQFRGQVKQVRFAPTTNQNVVTYTTIVDVNNADLKLRPGMTANASIVTAQKKEVVRIPNSALRFRPPEGVPVKGATNAPASSGAKTTNAVASGSSSGLPTPPWAGEGRRPTQEEREKWLATLTPEQREQYTAQMRERMRGRMGDGGGGGGGGRGFAGGSGFGGAGMFGGAPRVVQEGPRIQTIYMIDPDAPVDAKGGAALKPVTVKTGITDGTNTEVLEGLKEGDVVVTGVVTPEASPNLQRPPGGANPFGGGMRRF